MEPHQYPIPRPAGFATAPIAAETASFMRKVYAFMAAGLLATGVTAFAVASSYDAQRFIVGNRIVFYGIIFAQLALVWKFSSAVQRLSALGAGALFFAYAILNGLTLSIIFVAYTESSIASTFFVTAGTFGAMSLYGLVTHRDLTSVGNFVLMGLVGLIIASVVNIFLQSPMIYWLTTFMGVIVFVGLTAYDTQKIKQLNASGHADIGESHKHAIQGALTLYLDFINLFLFLLRLTGRRR